MRLLLALLLLVPVAAASPEQVRLGLSEDGVDPVVTWYDFVPTVSPAVVVSGPEGDVSFPAAQVQGPTLGFVYEARLSGLAPATEYTYTVGSGSFVLRTPDDDGAFVFAGLGDMGVTAQSAKTVDALRAAAPDLILHAGDISYGEGNQLTWNTWFKMTEPIAATVPWVTAIGNHEADVAGLDTDNGAAINAAEQAYYKQRFALPGNEFWYSFDWEGVHFVALDTYTQLRIPQEEIDWLAADLAANAEAPWTVVYFHEPPYSSNDHGQSAEAQAAFVDLFDEHGVDLVVNAHDHGYERTWPMRGGEAVVTNVSEAAAGLGTVHVVTGGGGESLYSGWEEPAPAWSATREALYHITIFRVTPDRIDMEVVPTDGSDFRDTFSLVRGLGSADNGGAPAAEIDNATPGLALPLALLAIAAIAAARRR